MDWNKTMVTKAKIVRDINWIRNSTHVKFNNFGSFFFRLMMQTVDNQEYIVDSLVNASKNVKPEEMIEIRSVHRVSASLQPGEERYRFVVEHGFKCKFCGKLHVEEVNLYGGQFRAVCEFCMDKAMEHRMDMVPESPDDHD
jgi:hypothetical protein